MTRINIQLLRARYQAGERFNYLFFLGHSGNEISKNCLSQWYPVNFEKEGVHYSSAEQFMMAAKAKLFNDTSTYNKILAITEPSDIKALGRQVKGFDQVVWDKHCLQIVIEGNFAKFSQNPLLLSYLQSTGDKVLVEASPYDNVWGIGLSETANNLDNPLVWRGSNLLGFSLMIVREQLNKGRT